MNLSIKKLVIILSFLIGTFLQTINAQESKKQSVKVNFLPALSENSDYLSYISFRTQFSITYEMQIGKIHPFLKATYIGPKQFFHYLTYDDNSEESYYNISGFGIGVGNRFYQNNQTNGIYLSPEIDFMNSKKFKPSEDGLLLFTKEYFASVLFGKQWVKTSGITIDIYTGIGMIFRNYREIIEDTETQTAEYNGMGIRPFFGLNLGYSF